VSSDKTESEMLCSLHGNAMGITVLGSVNVKSYSCIVVLYLSASPLSTSIS
jgi:hypothetical protein